MILWKIASGQPKRGFPCYNLTRRRSFLFGECCKHPDSSPMGPPFVFLRGYFGEAFRFVHLHGCSYVARRRCTNARIGGRHERVRGNHSVVRWIVPDNRGVFWDDFRTTRHRIPIQF